jgi:N utilization substance protein B
MASRRRGREMALQVLCMLERQPDLSVEQALRLFFNHLVGSDLDETTAAAASPRRGESVTRELEHFAAEKHFCEELTHGVRGELDSIDRLLGRCSRNWRLERMSWVDRNLLRLASFELTEQHTPVRVVLNEAIEIARRYSTSESSGFVNGVLDRVMQELGHKGPSPGAAKSATLQSALRDKEHAADPR